MISIDVDDRSGNLQERNHILLDKRGAKVLIRTLQEKQKKYLEEKQKKERRKKKKRIGQREQEY
jgi:hypothetical protein